VHGTASVNAAMVHILTVGWYFSSTLVGLSHVHHLLL